MSKITPILPRINPWKRQAAVSASVKIADAKTRLSELIVKVERGEDFIITRGNVPVARLVPIHELAHREALIEAILAERAAYKPVTQAEIQAWKHEDHRY